jgi:hypothetical protein
VYSPPWRGPFDVYGDVQRIGRMDFWETAAAAMVGGLGVLLFAGLCRFAWFFFRMRYTAFARQLVRTGTSVNETLSVRTANAVLTNAHNGTARADIGSGWHPRETAAQQHFRIRPGTSRQDGQRTSCSETSRRRVAGSRSHSSDQATAPNSGIPARAALPLGTLAP